jgi:hypothetical protein
MCSGPDQMEHHLLYVSERTNTRYHGVHIKTRVCVFEFDAFRTSQDPKQPDDIKILRRQWAPPGPYGARVLLEQPRADL